MPYIDLTKFNPNINSGGTAKQQTTSDSFNQITNAYLAAAASKGNNNPAKSTEQKDSGISASDEKKNKAKSPQPGAFFMSFFRKCGKIPHPKSLYKNTIKMSYFE